MASYFLRIGALAEIHVTQSPLDLKPGGRVIVRTNRGVEVAEVVRQFSESTQGSRPPSFDPGLVSSVRALRSVTDEDEWLIRRMQSHRREAIEACRRSLQKSGSGTVLLDIDQLFDGTLLMHFLGPTDELAKSVTKEIVDRYATIARTQDFAALLQNGCGPDCGSEEGGGCGSSCSGCAVSGACH